MERNDKAAIEALLKRHGFHFSKSMGQNFLIDPAIPYEIAESSRANEQNGVLEMTLPKRPKPEPRASGWVPR